MAYSYHRTASVSVPMVNLNGTSWSSLLDQVDGVRDALNKLSTALRNAEPHPRDYQMNPPGDYQAAKATSEKHQKLVRALKEYYGDLEEALLEQKR